MVKRGILTCSCQKQGCWRDKKNRLPVYCEANNYPEELDGLNKEYLKENNINIYKAACIVRERNDGMTPRIEEALMYAKELKLKRIGFAACIVLSRELELLIRLFTKEGFQVHSICCQIGGAGASKKGVPEM